MITNYKDRGSVNWKAPVANLLNVYVFPEMPFIADNGG